VGQYVSGHVDPAVLREDLVRTRRLPGRAHVALSILVAGALVTGLIVGEAAAASSATSITSVSLSARTVSQLGGSIVVTAHVAHAKSCSVRVAPALFTSPKSATCVSGVFRSTVSVPPNSSAFPVSYRVTVTAVGTRQVSAAVVFSSVAVSHTLTVAWPFLSHLPPPIGNPVGIGCAPDGSLCVAVDTSGNAFIDLAGTWSVDSMLDSAPFTSVACASATWCVAVDGAGDAVTFDGTNWTHPLPVATGRLVAVSCSAPMACLAVDIGGNGYWLSGSVWSGPTLVDSVSSPTSVSCSAASTCLVVDSSGGAHLYSSGSWSSVAGAPVDAVASSCPEASTCFVLDGEGDVSKLSGGVFMAPTSVLGGEGGAAISCSSSTSCVATGVAGSAAVFSNAVWSTPSAVDATTAFVSCASLSCVTIGSDGYSSQLSDTIWTPAAKVAAPTGRLTGYSCATSAACFVTDSSGYLYYLSGGKWLRRTTAARSLNAISCTTSDCTAVGDAGAVLRVAAPTWSPTFTSVGTSPFSSVGCASPTYCVAATADGTESTFNGSIWSAPLYFDVSGGRGFTAASCASGPVCAIADAKGVVAFGFFGTRRNIKVDTNGGMILASVCLARLVCLTGDAQGFVVKTTLAPKVSLGSPRRLATSAITSLACPQSFFCVAGDATGHFYYFLNGRWSGAQLIAPAAIVGLWCTIGTTCVAVDANGNVHTAGIGG
jgi:hypothetical protein